MPNQGVTHHLSAIKQDLGSGHSEHPDGEQYDPDDTGEYQISLGDDTEPIYLQAM